MITSSPILLEKNQIPRLIKAITEFCVSESGAGLVKCDTCGSRPDFVGNWITTEPEDHMTLVRQIWMCPSCRSVKREPYRLYQVDA